jgi:hypothetical protein
MTKSRIIEHVTAATVLLCVAGSVWRPRWTQLDEVALIVLIIGVSMAIGARTAADHERARRGSWLIPLLALAIAAQWVYLEPPDARLRPFLLGGGLVAAAFAWAWVRRRAA